MASTLENFHKALGKGELAPVYLIASEEPLLLQEACDALRARARALGFAEREVLDVDAKFDWNQLARASASMSLFSSRRLIELRVPTGLVGKEGSAAIVEWCKSPAADTVLLISAAQWGKKNEGAWVREIERNGVYVPIKALRVDELPAWIRARMHVRGFNPDDDAVALLASRAEGNLLAIAQEIDKLSMLREGGRVAASELEALDADNALFDVFKLTDAAFGGDAQRALRVLSGLRAEGEDVIPMLGWMLNQLELALRLASADDFAAAARAEYNFWPAKQRVFASALKRAGRGPSHWEHCVAWCARIDRMAKGRIVDDAGKAMGDPWQEMERLLVAIAQPRATAALA
ncbi:MAG TPA: DNA polymerase III subunit delta [Rhodanobacteraceae bacterium]|nr:DNA polymerase III subunit delta [Rhodanobacteraceae bacterium]